MLIAILKSALNIISQMDLFYLIPKPTSSGFSELLNIDGKWGNLHASTITIIIINL